MTDDYVLLTIFWAIFSLTAEAAEEIAIVFKRRITSRCNRQFALELIVKRKLAKFLDTVEKQKAEI